MTSARLRFNFSAAASSASTSSSETRAVTNSGFNPSDTEFVVVYA